MKNGSVPFYYWTFPKENGTLASLMDNFHETSADFQPHL